jgi:hypothetical protein
MKKENTLVKEDTFENWSKAKNFIPKKHEVIIYTNMGTKIGDGQTKVNDLPFINNKEYLVDGTTLIIKEGL